MPLGRSGLGVSAEPAGRALLAHGGSGEPEYPQDMRRQGMEGLGFTQARCFSQLHKCSMSALASQMRSLVPLE